ncbi:MAG: hypothetical protein H0U91_07780 [Rubrobacter sp.]|nr:hypothetical protein [Rubrobacter sp.]MDQ3362137.1 DUF4258 domain-containing protein [Actinomycetota bacterium]MDQ3375411.1 DUF4258 domain-containing protein [Actinomycetota bacterium]
MLRDHEGVEIRLTDERRTHVLEHPEMSDMETGIEETLLRPQLIVRSRSDEEVRLYYRFYSETRVGGKFLCVVVKVRVDDAFVITAYLTDKVKEGESLWNATS